VMPIFVEILRARRERRRVDAGQRS
jgi:hypothetical protein